MQANKLQQRSSTGFSGIFLQKLQTSIVLGLESANKVKVIMLNYKVESDM